MPEWGELSRAIFSPGNLVGHLAYLLLIVSMMMRTMKWLRALAIGSGLVSVLYGYFWLNDPVTVFWEALFVLVNVGQLAYLEWNNRYAKFDEDELHFIRTALGGMDKSLARSLLQYATPRKLAPGDVLTSEGEVAPALIFMISGKVNIESQGRLVGVCARGDFLGEISLINNEPATATAVAARAGRYLAFDRGDLITLLERDEPIRHALENSFNRNLGEKLIKSNQQVPD